MQLSLFLLPKIFIRNLIDNYRYYLYLYILPTFAVFMF